MTLLVLPLAFAAPVAGTEDPLPAVVAELAEAHPTIAGSPEAARLQLLLSVVRPGPNGPELERSGFRVDAEYFYPASAIKTCGAVAAIQTARAVESRTGSAVGLDTPLRFHPLFDDEVLEERDETNLDGGTITLRHELRKLFLVSDNRAYNRTYELVGHRELNRAMWDAGLDSVRLNHRLSEFRSVEDQRRTPAVEWLVSADETELSPQRTSDLVLTNEGPGLLVGRARATDAGVVEEPFDFTHKNGISLVDLQDLNVLLLRPDLRVGLDVDKKGFELTDDERAFLRRAMSDLPRESENPKYDPEDYPDSWGKWLLPGLERVAPRSSFTLCNKVGRAYGFSVENAYVEPRDGRPAFFLTAVLYTNANGVVNDGAYEYADADRFLAELGEAVARALWSGDD